MEKWLERDVPLYLSRLSERTLILPSSLHAVRTRAIRRPGRPVPIPFYGQPSAHSHCHAEIALVARGRVFFEIDGRPATLPAGTVVVLPGDVKHYDSYASPTAPYTILWYILWPGQPRANISGYSPAAGFDLSWVGQLRPDVLSADHWSFISSLSHAAPSLSTLRPLLFLLYAATLEARAAAGPMHKAEASRKVVRDAISFLDANLSQAPTVEMAAAYVGLSPTYLTTLVRKETGKPLHDVLSDLRLKRARQFLLDTSLSVKEIASRCGFASSEYFSRTFHNETGMTPRAFRDHSSAS